MLALDALERPHDGKDLQDRRRRPPVVAEDGRNQVGRRHDEPEHRRQAQRADRARRLQPVPADAGTIRLQPREGRIQDLLHRSDDSRQRRHHRVVGERVEPEGNRPEKAADEEVVRVLVHPHEDIGKQGAEPEGAEVGEARAREREARPPWVEQPQEGRRHRRDGKLLGHERPGAESCQRDANAHDRSCGYAREEAQLEAAEVHRAHQQRPVRRAERGDQEVRAQDGEQRRDGRLAVEVADPMRDDDPDPREEPAGRDAGPEQRRAVAVVDRRPLHDRRAHTEVCERDDEAREHQHHAGDAEVVRGQDSRESDRDDEAGALERDLRDQLPGEAPANPRAQLVKLEVRRSRRGHTGALSVWRRYEERSRVSAAGPLRTAAASPAFPTAGTSSARSSTIVTVPVPAKCRAKTSW